MGHHDENYPFLEKRDVHELRDVIRALNMTMSRIEPLLRADKTALEQISSAVAEIPALRRDLNQLLDVLTQKVTNGDADELAGKVENET